MRSMYMAGLAFVCVGVCAVSVSAEILGPEWTEIPDAGTLPSDGQVTMGPPAALTKIHGELTGNGFPGPGGDFQDMYLIEVFDPGLFFASTATADGGAASFDTQLFLFNFDGTGLLANDEQSTALPGPSRISQSSDDGSGFSLTTPGLYWLAISGTNSDPESLGGVIFDQVSPTEISGADGVGGSLPITGWTPPIGATGTYTIALNGVRFADVPSPGALPILAIGLIARRRRRS